MFPKEDIILIELAFKIGNISGCTPWYDFKKKSMSQTKCYKAIRIMWTIIYFCPLIYICLSFSSFNFNINRFGERGISVKTIFGFLHQIVLFASITNIILDIYLKEPLWQQFLLRYSQLHQELKLKNSRYNNLCMIALFLLFIYGHLFVLLLNTILLSEDSVFLAAFITNNIAIFNIIITVFMMCLFTTCLKSRYKNLNCTLRNTLLLSEKTMVLTRLEEYTFAQSIRDLGKMYKTLRVLVDIYNELFARKTLFLYLITFFEFIRQLTALLDRLEKFSVTSNVFVIWFVVSIFLSFSY